MQGQPRFDTANRKSDRRSVNETKPALFSTPGNVRVVGDAGNEIFEVIIARPCIPRALQQPKSKRPAGNSA
ncbi:MULTISPECIES: hypothetical protein [unclassified Bradyrhizobium]